MSERKFLGYRLLTGGRVTIVPASLQRAKNRIRQITRRRGRPCGVWTAGFVASSVAYG
ncbi:MAG: hypothetical protein MI757_06920 [Pirellulales bacterium]|nr:hypothetical protein [Pirellulales bacterium]